MKIFILTMLVLVFTGCGSKTYRNLQDDGIETPMEFESRLVEAKIIKEEFVNQGGRTIEGVYDYFLLFNGKKLFIKFMESDITLKDLEPYIGNMATFSISERQGLWDTDDPNVQSRIGNYVVIWSIENN